MQREFISPLPISIDRFADASLPVQISDSIRQLVSSGAVKPGDHLPSSRALAGRLSISRGSVVTAYDQLTAEGYLVAFPGAGTIVNPQLIQNPPIQHHAPPAPAPQPHGISLIPGRPYVHDLADAAWRSAWRRACTEHLSASHDPLGLWAFRVQIAEHIRRMRSLSVEPDRIAITAGAREGLALVLQAVAEEAAEQEAAQAAEDRTRPLRQKHTALVLGVESPGYPSLRRVPGRLGHTTVDLPTDVEGVDPSRFPSSGLDAVLITPNHQYPHGTTLPAPRRAQLARWVQETGTLLIEDDFDSELRYIDMPSPPVIADKSTDGVLLGTFSSVMSPELSCGYAVLPTRLLAPIRRIRSELGLPVSRITQGALATYMESGALRRRTQRLRRMYKRRQEVVTKYLGHLRGAKLHRITGGLHAVLETENNEESLVANLRRAGIAVTRLSDYWGGTTPTQGIVFGFGEVPMGDLLAALPIIAQVCQSPQKDASSHHSGRD